MIYDKVGNEKSKMVYRRRERNNHVVHKRAHLSGTE